MTERKKAGFLIVEVLMVLLLIAILVAVLLPYYTSYSKKAKFQNFVAVGTAAKSLVNACYARDGSLANCSIGVAAGNINAADLTGGSANPTITNGSVSIISIAISAGVIVVTGTIDSVSVTGTLTPTVIGTGIGTGLTWLQSCSPTEYCS